MNNDMICVPITIGEFADRFSILKIKEARVKNPIKLSIVHEDVVALNLLFPKVYPTLDACLEEAYNDHLNALQVVNGILWDLENTIRLLEKQKNFGTLFVETARKIFRANDRRAELKKDLSLAFGESEPEVKEYVAYD